MYPLLTEQDASALIKADRLATLTKRYAQWRNLISPAYRDLFEGQKWQNATGIWTRKSTCGVYRLLFYPDKIRIVKRGNA